MDYANAFGSPLAFLFEFNKDKRGRYFEKFVFGVRRFNHCSRGGGASRTDTALTGLALSKVRRGQ